MKPPPSLKRISDKPFRYRADNALGIESVSLRLPCTCNFSCRYCYSHEKQSKYHENSLRFFEIISFLEQAFQLGVTSVSLVGAGEPLLYKEGDKTVYDIIEFITAQKKTVIIFSNMTMVDERFLEFIKCKDVVLIGKRNFVLAEKNDAVIGIHGGSAKSEKALQLSINAGLNRDNRLGMHTVILRDNIDDIPVLWRQWRKAAIIPYVQVCVPPCEMSVAGYVENVVSPAEIMNLFRILLKIDRDEFGYNWDVIGTYPIAGLGCTVVRTGIALDIDGGIKICAYTGVSLGNIRETPLSSLLDSPTIRLIRTHSYGDPDGHYGCRALATILERDRFSVDPILRELRNGG